MKKVTNYVMAVLCVGSLAFSTGAFMKVNASPAVTAEAPGQPVDLTYAAEKALPAVVHIKYVQNSKMKTVDVQSDPFGGFFDPFGFFGNPGQGNGGTRKQQVQTPKREATGSGVIISADGYIVTNNHVVEGADELTVTLNDNREYSARIIGTDKTTDLALIKIDGKNLPTLPIANSDNVKVGEWVIAVGNPFGLNNTVTAGIISAKARSLGANGVESFIQTDAAINAGNSGGALVNTQGELVGINAMLYSQTGSYAGYGFAIPTSIISEAIHSSCRRIESLTSSCFFHQLRCFCITYLRNKKTNTKTITLKNAQGNTSVIKSADLDVLGGTFRPITESQKNQLSIKYGVEVMKVNSGALKDAGVSRGFIIQRINDNNITSLDDLQKAVKSASTSKDPVLYIQGVWPTGKKAYFAVPLQKD
jgi:S1-C subfamily serine protease